MITVASLTRNERDAVRFRDSAQRSRIREHGVSREHRFSKIWKMQKSGKPLDFERESSYIVVHLSRVPSSGGTLDFLIRLENGGHMQFTEQQLQEKWDELVRLVTDNITSPRKEQLLALYEKYQERIALAPASAKEHYHNAFPGGYLNHILRVTRNALAIYSVWKEAGAKVDNFTVEELVFSALNHDLGKIGDEDGEYYVPNTSDWHRNNQGTIYNINPNVTWMNVTDRSFYLLQSEGIKVSRNEYIAIHLTDGLYEEKNKPYLVGYDKNFQLRFNLPIILHHADMLALHTERDAWKKEVADNPVTEMKKGNPQTFPKKAKSDPQKRNNDLKDTFSKSPNAKSIFDNLFIGGTPEKE